MRISLMLLAAPALLLAGCGSEPEPTAEPANDGDDRTAKGDVLGGTVSDEMLPLESLRSQAPSLASSPSGEEAEGDESGE